MVIVLLWICHPVLQECQFGIEFRREISTFWLGYLFILKCVPSLSRVMKYVFLVWTIEEVFLLLYLGFIVLPRVVTVLIPEVRSCNFGYGRDFSTLWMGLRVFPLSVRALSIIIKISFLISIMEEISHPFIRALFLFLKMLFVCPYS